MLKINAIQHLSVFEWYLLFKYLYAYLYPELASSIYQYPVNFNFINTIQLLQDTLKYYTQEEETRLLNYINNHFNIKFQDFMQLYDWLEIEKLKLTISSTDKKT